jgi:lysophosphatidylcholine acyltransferase/lyso-PAF acetyltransferase
MWLVLILFYTISVVLVELALKKLEKIKEFYKDKPISVDVMRRFDICHWSRPTLYFGAVFLFPRVFLFLLCVLMHFLTSKLAMIGYEEKDVPLHYIRRFLLVKSSRFWARLLMFSVGFWKIRTVGVPGDCHVIAANHTSWVDIMYFLTSPELPSFVSKASVKNFYCVGVIATAMQCIFIERTGDKEGALNAIRKRQKIIKNGFPKLLVFPEGTTTNGQGLMPFKRGGFVEMLPVQPVCIKYEEGYFSPCMEIVPMWTHVIMLACQFQNSMTVTRLPVVTPKPTWTPESYAEHVRGIIADHLDIPKVDYDIDKKSKLITEIFSEKPKEF